MMLFSCANNHDHEVSRVEIVTYHKNGGLKSKKIANRNDSTIFNYVEYYENGKLFKKGSMQDSIVMGYWEYFFDNGNLMQKGKYIIDDSLNNGLHTYSYWMPQYDDNGKIKEENDGWMCSLSWKARDDQNIHVCKSGYWEFFHENGEVKVKTKFVRGRIDGNYFEYFDNKQLALKAKYQHGKPVGQWTYYYPNGQLKKTVRHSASIELVDCFYLIDGTRTLTNGTGTIYDVDNDGDSTVIEFKNHLNHGRSFNYKKRIDNNNHYEIDTEHHYLNGKLNGKSRYFNNYGKTYEERMSSELNYVNDNFHGFVYGFYRGKKIQIRYFIRGLEHGTTKHFNENTGKLELIEPWVMGERHGIRKYFTYSGEPELYQYFYEGEMVGKIDFENGLKVKTTIYEDDTLKFNKL